MINIKKKFVDNEYITNLNFVLLIILPVSLLVGSAVINFVIILMIELDYKIYAELIFCISAKINFRKFYINCNIFYTKNSIFFKYSENNKMFKYGKNKILN